MGQQGACPQYNRSPTPGSTRLTKYLHTFCLLLNWKGETKSGTVCVFVGNFHFSSTSWNLELLKVPHGAPPPDHVTTCHFLFGGLTSWSCWVSSPGPALYAALVHRCCSLEPRTLPELRRSRRHRPGPLRQGSPEVPGAPQNRS